MQLVSFKKVERENYGDQRVMADPGIHAAAAREIQNLLPRDANILEIGAGAGAFSARLRDAGLRVTAVDVDDSHFVASGVEFRKISVDDKLSTTFGQNQFPAVVAIEVIEHVRSTWTFLREAYDLLQPGGYLFVTTPNLCSFYGRIVFLKEGRFYHFQGEGSWKDIGHINPLPFFVLEQMAEDIGFKLTFRQCLGTMPVLDWSRITPRTLLSAVARLALYPLMRGPGPIDGNILFYCLQKPR